MHWTSPPPVWPHQWLIINGVLVIKITLRIVLLSTIIYYYYYHYFGYFKILKRIFVWKCSVVLLLWLFALCFTDNNTKIMHKSKTFVLKGHCNMYIYIYKWFDSECQWKLCFCFCSFLFFSFLFLSYCCVLHYHSLTVRLHWINTIYSIRNSWSINPLNFC